MCQSSLVVMPLDTEAPAGLIAFFQAAANGRMSITSDTVTTREYRICAQMLDYYRKHSFLEQSSTMSNTQILAEVLRKSHGVEPREEIQRFEDVVIYPSK